MAKKLRIKRVVPNPKKNILYFIDGKGDLYETSMNRKGGKKGVKRKTYTKKKK